MPNKTRHAVHDLRRARRQRVADALKAVERIIGNNKFADGLIVIVSSKRGDDPAMIRAGSMEDKRAATLALSKAKLGLITSPPEPGEE